MNARFFLVIACAHLQEAYRKLGEGEIKPRDAEIRNFLEFMLLALEDFLSGKDIPTIHLGSPKPPMPQPAEALKTGSVDESQFGNGGQQ